MELHPLINSIGNLFEAALIVMLFDRIRKQAKHIRQLQIATVQEAQLLDMVVEVLEKEDTK